VTLGSDICDISKIWYKRSLFNKLTKNWCVMCGWSSIASSHIRLSGVAIKRNLGGSLSRCIFASVLRRYRVWMRREFLQS
jgi:hypothetical protein